MMTSWKALRRGVLVGAIVALLSGLMVASVSAQPPTPPDRFFGNVTLNGAAAAAGTNVTATIGGEGGGPAAAAAGRFFGERAREGGGGRRGHQCHGYYWRERVWPDDGAGGLVVCVGRGVERTDGGVRHRGSVGELHG